MSMRWRRPTGPVERLAFIESGTVELIYASHVLEHFGRHAYRSVLEEWFRLLAPQGVLRLAVPDFEACAKLYCEGRLNKLSDIVGLIVGGQRDDYDYHKMIFDERTLSDELRSIGFRDVRRWDWRSTEHASVDDYSQAYLPHLDKETRHACESESGSREVNARCRRGAPS